MTDDAQLPHIPEPRDIAFFFDFDGTLVDIVDDPEAVRVQTATLQALERLSRASGGAVAIVSGRSIAQIDGFLSPLLLPAAGVHGRERRDGQGRLTSVRFDAGVFSSLARKIEAFVQEREGLLAEVKQGTIALHYRMAPHLEAACLNFAETVREWNPAIGVMRGKMVVEFMLGSRSKGMAIAEFLDEAPFRGRRPLFAGDDVTDEAGFAEVGARDGITIKIGEGDSLARFRFDGPAAFRRWLGVQAKIFSELDLPR